MPLFDLCCEKCGERYPDYLLGLSEPLPDCKKCGATLKKEIKPNAKMHENWSEWQREGKKK